MKLESITFVMNHLQGREDSEKSQIVEEIVVNGDHDMEQANIFKWDRLDEVWRSGAIPTLMLTR